MNATQLRADVYAVLDRVLETGEPVVIERKGQRIVLTVEKAKRQKRRRLPKERADWVVGNVDDIGAIDWSKYWRP